MAALRRAALCAALLVGAATVSAQTMPETQVLTFSSKPAGGSLQLYFTGEEGTPLTVNILSTATGAAVVARDVAMALTAYFNGSMTVTVTGAETPSYTLTLVFGRGVPQLVANSRRLLPLGASVYSSTTRDGQSSPTCQEAAATVLRCHYNSMPDMAPAGYMMDYSGPHRDACCRNASILIPACGGTPETLFEQWGRITGNFDANSSSILMSYVGACPRARSDLTRPAVPAEVCEARIQGALACANDVLNRQTFTFMSPRDTLKSMSDACCQNVTGLEYACLGRDIDNHTSASPMAVYWTIPASEPFFLTTRTTWGPMGMNPTYNSSVTSGMDPNAVNVLREFLVNSSVVYSMMEAYMFNITVNVDTTMVATFVIEFPMHLGSLGGMELPQVFYTQYGYSMPTMLREYGYSRDAAILRFLLDGRPDVLANLLTGGTAWYMYNITEKSLPELTCRAFTPNFCQAGVQLTYTCLSTTIADRRGAVTPVCTHLSNMIDTLCKGYPWRTLLGNGTLTLTPPPVPPMTFADAYRGIFRLNEVNRLGQGYCNWSVEGMKISASGRVYSDRCPAANGASCMSTTPTTVQFGIPYYEVSNNVPGYQALSPECGAN